MAKPILLVGRTELLAAIYDEDNLPSAIVAPKGDKRRPHCLHSLREGDEQQLNELVQHTLNDVQGIKDPEQAEFLLYRFYEDFPEQDYNCIGCNILASQGKAEDTHLIRDSETACRKTCDDCA